MQPVLTTHFGNPSSTSHAFGWYAAELVSIAREQVAALLNSASEEVIFTSSASESNNMAIKGVAFEYLKSSPKEKPHILSVATEHPSTLDALDALAKFGMNVTILRVNSDGSLDIDSFKKNLRPNTVFASAMLANNEIGTIHDIAKLARIARHNNSLFHCDATQAIGKIPVDVQALGVDMLSLSGHKFHAPKGIGALYIRNRSPRIALEPLIHGGLHECGRRGSTLNVSGIVGLGKACEIAKASLSENSSHLQRLTETFLTYLSANLSDFSINGPLEKRLPGNISLTFKGVENSLLLGKISSQIAISPSSACVSESGKYSHVLLALGLNYENVRSSVRLGFSKFNSEGDASIAADIIAQAVKELRSLKSGNLGSN